MKRILVVDDSLFQRKTISSMLIEAGYEVVEATDGCDGLEKLRDCSPDCILTDLLMPQMNGIEFIAELKARGCVLPVFVLTADIQESRRRICLEMGIDGFISKPPKRVELLGAINRRLTPSEAP